MQEKLFFSRETYLCSRETRLCGDKRVCALWAKTKGRARPVPMSPRSVLLLSVFLFLSVQALAWQFGQWARGTRANTQLHMARTKALQNVKSKYTGRFDLTSMVDEDTIDDAPSSELFEEADREEVHPPTTGQKVTGVVIDMDENGALLEVGGKMSGYLPLAEASLLPLRHVNQILEIGQEVSAEVVGTLKGMPVLSLRASQLESAWQQVFKLRATDETFEVVVQDVNRGGAICNVFGLQAFLPGSHFNGLPDSSMIGSTIRVSIFVQYTISALIE
jgi:predicted RNA-binding protein with RPS1 domain